MLLFTACSGNNNCAYSLIDSSDNYELYAYTDKNDVLSDYIFFVFNNNGDKIKSGYFEAGEPRFTEFDNDILKVSTGAGTNAQIVTYYDLSSSLVSSEYQNVYYDDGDLVVYIDYDKDKTFITAQKIFNSEVLLREELDMGGIFATNFDVSVKDETITVEHIKGENYETITETFKLIKSES